MGNVCGSTAVKGDSISSSPSGGGGGAVAEIQTNDASAPHNKHVLAEAAPQNGDSAHSRASTDGKGGSDQRRGSLGDAAYNCHSVQSVKGDEPASISIKVAPAPPPDEYPEIRAAVQAAQKEVKAGTKLKFANLYTLGQVIGTGHYARCAPCAVLSVPCGSPAAVSPLLPGCRHVHCNSAAHLSTRPTHQILVHISATPLWHATELAVCSPCVCPPAGCKLQRL